jgi:hypothetical protein
MEWYLLLLAFTYLLCVFVFLFSGKTYTTEGELQSPSGEPSPPSSISSRPLDYESALPSTAGILPRALERLLNSVSTLRQNQTSVRTEYTIRATYIEIYNEIVYDLLGNLNVVSICENPKDGSFYCSNARSVSLHRMSDVHRAIARGAKHKRMADTLLNAHSSRSHTIFTVFIQIQQFLDNKGVSSISRVGKLHLVDLAGSERLSASKVEGIHLREASSINQSLFAVRNNIE